MNDKLASQIDLFEEWLQIRDPSNSHYPSVLGLTPMFLPVKDRKKGDTKTWGDKGGEFYKAGDYTIQRFGPGLSTYDEDTLIAILQISGERRIVGEEDDVREKFLPGLPDNIASSSFTPKIRNAYFVGTVSAYKINKYFGRETSGSGLAACVESMVRLTQTRLTISKKGSSTIADVGFFSLIRDENDSAPITVVIDPIMAGMLQDYVVMNLNIRRKLTPIGKGVYRYLESSGVTTIPLTELMERIGTTLSVSDFNRALLGRNPTKNTAGTLGELRILQDAGWLRSYAITGTGRNHPFILQIERS